MSSDIAIQVENLSKCYQIYDKPRDRLLQGIIPPFQRLVGKEPKQYFREFWSLRDISFDIKKGEAFAIIGRNGAGKSTLLQMIAGTLTPTNGTVQVNGRIAALLELGSGFNHEFTGRENVWMNASILGLSQDAIGAKFDEIAAFADIGDFMDQPIKTYSSGMMMRLAFSVQTAIDPAILIVDEALSVGDVFFQAKCMLRLRKLVDNGVTLLFVSHDTGTVRQMCSRAVLLSNGKISGLGTAASITDQYMKTVYDEYNERAQCAEAALTTNVDLPNTQPPIDLSDGEETLHCAQNHPLLPEYLYGQAAFLERAKFERVCNQDAELINVQLYKNGTMMDVFNFGDLVTVKLLIKFNKTAKFINIAYKVRTLNGVDVLFCDTRLVDLYGIQYEAGKFYAIDWKFKLTLIQGSYCIAAAIVYPPSPEKTDWEIVDLVPIAYQFTVLQKNNGSIDALVAVDNEVNITCLSH